MKKDCSRRSDLHMFRILPKPSWVVMTILVLGSVLFSIPSFKAQETMQNSPQQSVPDPGAQTVDDLFMQMARRKPSFGGMFVDEKKQILYVYSKDPRREELSFLRKELDDVMGSVAVPQFRIQVLPAQYGFDELKNWQEVMTAEILAIRGVVLVDVDETKNRVTVGVERLRIRRAVEDALKRLGVPRAAVNIRVTRPIRLETSLRDRHRPLVGGLQINFSGSLCTLGFNATRENVDGFVTNSHCTATQGGVEATVYHQHTESGTANRVGVEIVDPTYVTGGACPASRRCRRSDSAFVQRDTGVNASLGGLARPALNSTAWNGVDQFRIVAEGPVLVGQSVTKVGRTLGRTQGNVSQTCTNVNVLNTNITLLCQSQAGYASDSGDSGSPVFRITNSPAVNDVVLVGIHWGSGATFSPIANIQETGELGPVTTESSIRGGAPPRIVEVRRQ
jgi:hypothetical protein